jgi:hypothetical protein
MPVEVVGQQLRIRVRAPSDFQKGSFRTQKLGVHGRLDRIAGMRKGSGEWETQSWRLNLSNYGNLAQVHDDLKALYHTHNITENQLEEAEKEALAWWRKNKR